MAIVSVSCRARVGQRPQGTSTPGRSSMNTGQW